MADDQDVTNKDVKTSIDYNSSMIESMFQILQSMQGQNRMIEKRIGSIESDIHSLRTKSKMADGEKSKVAVGDVSKGTSSNVPMQPEVNKEMLQTCLTEMSVDVKSFVRDEAADITQDNQTRHDVTNNNMAELERKLNSKLDALMTTQGNTAKKVNQMVKEVNQMAKEVQGLNESDSDMSEKLSGLIRCSAHGSIKVHQELVALTASAENSNAKLSSEMKTQTRSLKSNQNVVKQVLGGELAVLKVIADKQTGELKTVKEIAEHQGLQLDRVADIVVNNLPDSDQVMLKDELKDELQNLKKIVGKASFLKKEDFASSGDYEKYVKEHIQVGMRVQYCFSGFNKHGIVTGDVGTVTECVDGGVHIDWAPKGKTYFVYQSLKLIS